MRRLALDRSLPPSEALGRISRGQAATLGA
jgi:hypothetical protein